MQLPSRKLNRLYGYDYTSDNLYFITACVKDHQCSFGKIENDVMVLNEYGQIASSQWEWLIKKFTYTYSHAFTVMPNHIHGIIEINSTYNDVQEESDIKIKSLSELIGAYKTTSSKAIHVAGLQEFAWQRSFYDHIIRSETSFNNIENYIECNASNWRKDKFYIENIL